MADDDLPTVELGPGEVELMVFVSTTKGMYAEPFPTLNVLDAGEQASAVRQIVTQLRKMAEHLEERAGLVSAVEEAMSP